MEKLNKDCKTAICPVEKAKGLDSKIRQWLQNPKKILNPYIVPDMKVLDFGCGTGFFSIEIASMLNGSGTLVAADLQQGMLDIVSKKIKNTELEQIIHLHKCETDRIGLSDKFDLIVAFYVIHEIPNHESLFKELRTLLNVDGKLLIVEPKFHVQKKDFDKMVNKIVNNGFEIVGKPKLFLSRGILIQRTS